MNNKLLLLGLGIAVVVLLGGWYFFAGPGATPKQVTETPVNVVQQPKAITGTLALNERKLTPNIVTVTQGDQVTIKVMPDESGEFHISGYEIENDMTAGTELSFSFTADKAGRYNFELHPKAEGAGEDHDSEAIEDTSTEKEEDIVIGAFVVNPR